MLKAISVDVEEYFHASNVEAIAPRNTWDSLPSRVVESTERLLALFDAHHTKATFFVLGIVARQHPTLVKTIVQAGHELGSHGYEHRLVYSQTERDFFKDILDAKSILEDISGVSVKGYRAPNFSINERTPWAYEALSKAGYLYDSSLHPVWHPRYANLGKNPKPHPIETPHGTLYELPLSSMKLFGHIRVSVSGGAYWRLFPKWFIDIGIRSSLKENLPLNCYLHPWEIDSEQPLTVLGKLSPITRFRHAGRSQSFEARLSAYLKEHRFDTVLSQLGHYYPEALSV
jgi:polysaccharide deacetylase family protein (PEP-CTERM system associated)